MAEMIELKRKPKETTADKEVYGGPWPADDYPVRMWLENDQLDQLGLKTLEVGKEMTITAKVKVTSFSSNETDQGANKSAQLSVMSMGLMGEAEPKSAASVLYGDKKDGQ